jgi:hypothetical protein
VKRMDDRVAVVERRKEDLVCSLLLFVAYYRLLIYSFGYHGLKRRQ